MYSHFDWAAVSRLLAALLLATLVLPGCANDVQSLQYRVPAAIVVRAAADSAEVQFQRAFPASQFKVLAGTGAGDNYRIVSEVSVRSCVSDVCVGLVENLDPASTLTFQILQDPSESVQLQPVVDVPLPPPAATERGVDIEPNTANPINSSTGTVSTGLEFMQPAEFSSYECDVRWGDGTEATFAPCTPAQLRDAVHTYADGTYLLNIDIRGLPDNVGTRVQLPVCIGATGAGRCDPL